MTSSLEASMIEGSLLQSTPALKSGGTSTTSVLKSGGTSTSSLVTLMTPTTTLIRVLDISSNHLRDLRELEGEGGGERVFTQLQEVCRLDLKQNHLEQLSSELFKVMQCSQHTYASYHA